MKISFYLHNNYENSELKEYLRDEAGIVDPEVIENLSEQMYNKFYEVEFEIEADGKGNITNISLK